jgi:hypothetical protein
LADSRHPIVAKLILEPMPVNRAWLWEFILEDHADPVTLRDLNGRAGSTPVKTPNVDRLLWSNLLLHDVGRQTKDLYVAIHLVGKVANIRCYDRGIEVGRSATIHLGQRTAADPKIAAGIA